MSTRLISFSKKFNLLCPEQFGFQKNLTTADALINSLNHVYDGLNHGEHVANVFVDLRKAFDTINHNILLDKLRFYGVRGSQFNCFTDFLTDRT